MYQDTISKCPHLGALLCCPLDKGQKMPLIKGTPKEDKPPNKGQSKSTLPQKIAPEIGNLKNGWSWSHCMYICTRNVNSIIAVSIHNNQLNAEGK